MHINNEKSCCPQQVVFRKQMAYSKVAVYKCKLADYSKLAVYKCKPADYNKVAVYKCKLADYSKAVVYKCLQVLDTVEVTPFFQIFFVKQWFTCVNQWFTV